MYNDFMDELEYAAEVGFNAVWVNEHRSNGRGLWWPKPMRADERAGISPFKPSIAAE